MQQEHIYETSTAVVPCRLGTKKVNRQLPYSDIMHRSQSMENIILEDLMWVWELCGCRECRWSGLSPCFFGTSYVYFELGTPADNMPFDLVDTELLLFHEWFAPVTALQRIPFLPAYLSRPVGFSFFVSYSSPTGGLALSTSVSCPLPLSALLVVTRQTGTQTRLTELKAPITPVSEVLC